MFNHRGTTETMGSDTLHFFFFFFLNMKLLIAFQKICWENRALTFPEVSKRGSQTFEVQLQPSK